MSLGDRMTADSYERTVSCAKCSKTYRQIVDDQASGFRMLSEDTCPYCGWINHKSMQAEYTNFKLPEISELKSSAESNQIRTKLVGIKRKIADLSEEINQLEGILDCST